MPKALSAEDERFLRDFLDERCGKYLSMADTLCYLWVDEVPPENFPVFGMPVPKDRGWLGNAKLRKQSQRMLIEKWIGHWKFDRQYGAPLQQLLKMLLENGLPIPEPLQAWAYQVAVETKLPRPPGRQQNLDFNLRIYEAYEFLTKEKRFSQNATYKIIAEKTCRSPEAIKSVIRKQRDLLEDRAEAILKAI